MSDERKILSKSGYTVFIFLIILFSFRLFSTIFYPLVNADEGVIVLMLHYFKFPDDLYFWGQNRYGAIVPLLGQIPFRLFGLSSLVSEAIIHYLILIGGFFAFSAFIKSKINRIFFAAVWFLPPLYDTDLLRNVFGLQYSIIGVLFYLLYRYQPDYQFKSWSSTLPFYTLLLVLLILAFWVSDLSITSVLAFIVGNLFFLIKQGKAKVLIRKFETYFLVFSLLTTFLIITYLKGVVEVSPFEKYGDKLLIDFPAITKSVMLLFSSIGSILSFHIPDFLFSIYCYLIISILILTFIFKKKITIGMQDARWATVFILDGMILVTVIILSNWAFINEMPRRYFVGAYISFCLAFLIILSHFSPGRIKTVISVLTGLTIGIGALSSVYSYKYIYPKSLRPKADLAGEFTRLGHTGIVTDYWNSYGTSFANPGVIKATPFEGSYAVRNDKMVDSVFAQPKIILIKDLWMDDFPDSVAQFGRILIRKDSSFFIGGCQANEYNIKRNWVFDVDDLKHSPGLAGFDNSIDKEVIKIGDGHEASIYKHIVFGPFINLLQGRYEVSFNIRFDSIFTKENHIAILDVASDFGQKKINSLTLSPSLIPSLKNFHEYKMEFCIEEKTSSVEFRIYYLGGAYLTFDKIRLRWLPD